MRQNERRVEVVVVTGASAGVGRAIVREFAKHGASIGLLARSRDGLEGARREVEEAGERAIAVQTDMSDPQQVEDAADTVTRELGPIDVWVNVAMVTVLSPAVDMTPEDYQRVTNVSYLGYVYGTLAAVRRMRERNKGKIIQVGSALAYRSIPLQSAYCGAKHAIQGFTDSLRSELIHDGSHIDITTLQLPAVNTPQFTWAKSRMPHHPQPVPPIYQPEVIARAAYWAAHHRRRELWIGFSAVKAIIGQKLMPGFADHYLAWMGYHSQQTDQPVNPHRPNNLHEPLSGDFGAHGEFDSKSRSFSLQSWLNMRRNWISLTSLGLAAGYMCYAKAQSKRARHRLGCRHRH
ncbi:MAG: SDR family oxidoreductase [Nitrospira sp.]|nr:SDR family oxidoreductase [Nitrospira sp.]